MFFLMSFYLFMLNFMIWLVSMKFLINKINLIIFWNMLFLNSIKIEYLIYLDWMSLLFISTILLISSMVILYSIEYMNMDFYIKRFMLLILIFVISMIFMIISMNMFSILLGWDGLGLSSYCLVAYYQNKKSFNSSMITILMNRIGDIMILLCIGLMISYGSLNFLMFNNLNIIMILMIFFASITKSAQIPFSTWLPMAMAAPTPISSLVHSSTLVTAGVYLLIRFYHLLNLNFLFFLMILSSITMFMSGMSANFEFDLKKIIALSTLSQLGLMILTISLNLPNLAFFHLITHAMFKSLMFLCSGIIIHNYFNFQDIRYISFLNKKFPFVNSTFKISTLTLCGMPFLTGFYSKDLIIEMFNMNYNNYLLFLLMYLSMMFTVSYSFRLIYYINLKFNKLNFIKIYNFNNFMNYSIFILLMMSIFYGSILNWLMFSSINNVFLPKKLKMLIFILILLTIFFTIFILKFKLNNFFMFYFKNIMKFMNMMWFLSLMMKKNKMNIFLLNNKLNYINDLGWNEYFISKKIINMFIKLFYLKNFKNLSFLIMMNIMFYYLIFILIFF